MSWKASEGLLRTIRHYAKFPATGVSLRQMVQFGERPSTGMAPPILLTRPSHPSLCSPTSFRVAHGPELVLSPHGLDLRALTDESNRRNPLPRLTVLGRGAAHPSGPSRPGA